MNKDALYASLLDVLENTEDADKYTDIQYKFGDCNPKSERVLVADNSHFVYSKIYSSHRRADLRPDLRGTKRPDPVRRSGP